MADIIIKFPTRSRPEKFKKVLTKYIDYLSGKHDVRFIVTMDDDDETMNTPEMKEWLDSLKVPLKYNYGQSKNKIEAVNADMEGEVCDIIIQVSDDMIPCLEGYDDIVANGFAHCFPDNCGAIRFWDGIRPKEDLLMCLTVIGYPLYKAIGHLYHPDYESIYADNELTTICAKLEKLAISPVCVIRHEWVPGTHEDADEMHRQQESPEQYKIDGATYQRRMALNFDIDKVKERLDAQGLIKT